MLHEDGDQLIALRKALHHLPRDGPHERGLAAVRGAQKAVELVFLQVQLCVPEESDGAIGQREGALVEVGACLVVVVEVDLLGSRLPGRGAGNLRVAS